MEQAIDMELVERFGRFSDGRLFIENGKDVGNALMIPLESIKGVHNDGNGTRELIYETEQSA